MITIRPYQLQHRPALIRVIDTVCAECAYMETTRYTPTPAWEQALNGPEAGVFHLLLAFREEELLGWCRLFPLDEPDAARLELGLGVLAYARRVGIGTRLMDGALNQACQSGAGEIRLTTAAANTPAQALFNHFGFRVIERQGDRLVMALPLLPGVGPMVKYGGVPIYEEIH